MSAVLRFRRSPVVASPPLLVGQATQGAREASDFRLISGLADVPGSGTDFALPGLMPEPPATHLSDTEVLPGAPWPQIASRGRVTALDPRVLTARALRTVTDRVDASARLALLERTCTFQGARLLDALAEHLASATGASYALVAERGESDPARLRVLSAWAGDRHTESFDFETAGSAWADVMADGLRGYDRGLGQLFPSGAGVPVWPAASFAGIALHDHAGAVIGVLAVAHDRPMRLDDDVASMLRIFAARAGAELDRRRLAAQNERMQRDLEARVARRTAALAAANRELEAFSYSVSHDLRAPLRQISGFATLLADETGEDLAPLARQRLADITDAARSMGMLIERMLDFARAGRTDLRRADVDMTALARDVVAETSREAGDRAIEWTVGSLPRVRGDAVLLRQVLRNLLSNAVKYSRPCNLACIEIGVLVSDEPGDVVCFVRDNGVGFDMRHVNGLFSAFRRLHAAAVFEGAGVGLANVRRIVERHGGRVWATGAVAGGATFFFSLPTTGDVPASGHENDSGQVMAS